MQLVLITRDVNIRSTFFARLAIDYLDKIIYGLAKVCVYILACVGLVGFELFEI